MNKIKQSGQQTDWNEAFSGKSKGNQHLERIVKLARFIAKKESADLDVAEAGAWLHDTPLAKGSDYDIKKVKQSAEDYINGLGIKNAKLAETLISCIVSHEGLVKTKSREAMVVHDADVLEKYGLLGLIRHTWKSVNLGLMDKDSIDDQIVQEIFEHIRFRKNNLYFETSKHLAKNFDQALEKAERLDNIIEIIQKIARLAHQGVITEEVVMLLKEDLPDDLHRTLIDQINQLYLQKENPKPKSA